MDPKGQVLHHTAILKCALLYKVCVQSMDAGGTMVAVGNGESDLLKGAADAAHTELAKQLKPISDAVKESEKLKKQESNRKQMENTMAAIFDPNWNSCLAIMLKRGNVNQVMGDALQLFVSKTLEQACESKCPRIVGMDTEGQASTEEQPFAHAHYMQLAAGIDNECVVFRTSTDNLEIALPLFLHDKIVVAVVGKAQDCSILKKLIGGDNQAWMERIADVQEMGKTRMNMDHAPSLQDMLTFIWQKDPPLKKFLMEVEEGEESKGRGGRDKAYACFDDDTITALKPDMLLYAALDAMAAKALYEHFITPPLPPPSQ
jgi:hypothetical protein